MKIFLPTLLFTLRGFLFTPIIGLLLRIKNNNPGNTDLLIIIYDMCHAHKMLLPQLNYSKKNSWIIHFIQDPGVSQEENVYPITN